MPLRTHALLVILAVAAAVSNLAAQSGTPRFVFGDDAVVRIRGDRIGELRERWPDTALGRLWTDPAIVDLVERIGRDREVARERDRLALAEASRLGIALEDYEIGNLFSAVGAMATAPPVSEWRAAAQAMAFEPGSPAPHNAFAVACMPQFEGRWTKEFESESARLRQAPWFLPAAEQKIGGVPAHVFESELIERFGEGERRMGHWRLHLPGWFVSGSGRPELFGQVDFEAPPVPRSGLHLEVDVARFAKQVEPPVELQMTVLRGLERLTWDLGFVGSDVRDELVVELGPAEERALLWRALRAGEAPMPEQALPDDALLQLRGSLDWPHAQAALLELGKDELRLPAELTDQLAAALDGSIALGVVAPPVGGLVPRIYLTLGLADREAFFGRIVPAVAAKVPLKAVTYGEVECQILQIPGAPQGVQPAFCVVGDQLHIAESARSLRTFLKVQADGVDAMAVGEAAVPAGAGELLPFDLRIDVGRLYEAYYETWMPLLGATMAFTGASAGGALGSTRDVMPDPEFVAELARPMRGVLRRDGDTLRLVQVGPFGGVAMVAYLAVTPLMLRAGGAQVGSGSFLAEPIGRHKLRIVGAAIEDFETENGRRPRDLGELFASARLPADALLLPGDENAEAFTLADGKTAKTSFRYFPAGAKVSDFSNTVEVVLLQIEPMTYGRMALDAALEPDVIYGDDRTTPIDSIGK